MSTTDKGNELEQFVINTLRGFDASTKKARKEDGDVVSQDFLIECKNFDTKSVTIENDHWEKIERRAYALEKFPIYVRQNSTGRVIASMNFTDLVFLLARLRNG
jgi:hypothetical protein